MPDFNSPDAKNKFLDNHYKNKAKEIDLQQAAVKQEARETRKENRERVSIFISVCSLFISFFTLLLSLHLHGLL